MPHRLEAFDWGDLRFFLAVARAGTLRGGAAAIGANHATVSRRLTLLEASLEARLFDRVKAGLRLTQLGEELLPYAQRIEEEITGAARVVAGRDARPSGPIYLSIPPFMAISSLMDDLADFGRRFEGISIHLDVTNAFANLESREADISLRYAYEVTEDVIGRNLVRCSRAAYCSPAYASTIKNNGGEGLTWIGWTEGEGETTAPWVKETAYPKALIRHRINEGVPQLSLASAGMGLSYGPCFVGDFHPGLVRAPFQDPVPDRNLWLLLHSDLRKTARIRLFVDFLAERIRGRREDFTAGAI